MSSLRALWRLLAFSVFTAFMFALVILVRVACLFAPASFRRSRTALFHAWARLVARLLGMRIEMAGPPPRPPFLLISNHLSYMDIVLLANVVNAVFVAKMEVAGWPLLGPVVRSVNTIFVNRGSRRDLLRVNGEISDALAAGEGVVVFAEGTSTDGSTVLPLKPSMLEAALAERRPIRYARLTYATPDGAPDASGVVCWWDDTPLINHIMRLFRLRSFSALVHFGSDAVEGSDRKELAQVLRGKISALPEISRQALNAN